ATISGTNDGAIEGGGFAVPADTSVMFSRSLFQIPKTGKWAIAFRGILATGGTASDYQAIGIANAAASHQVACLIENSKGSGANYYLSVLGAGETAVDTTIANSGAIFTGMITFDGTTVKLFLNGTLRASTATLTNLNDEPMFAYAFNHVAGKAKVARIAYGYIAP